MRIVVVAVIIFSSLSLYYCYRMRGSRGGGPIETVQVRALDPNDMLLMPCYKIEMVAKDLSFPTGIAFDDAGRLYVVESGYSYGEVRRKHRSTMCLSVYVDLMEPWTYKLNLAMI